MSDAPDAPSPDAPDGSEHPEEPDRPNSAIRLAAGLVALEAVGLIALAVAEIVNLDWDHPAAGVTQAVFFLLYAAGLALCARGLLRLSSWTRGPIVVAQLIELGVAWKLPWRRDHLGDRAAGDPGGDRARSHVRAGHDGRALRSPLQRRHHLTARLVPHANGPDHQRRSGPAYVEGGQPFLVSQKISAISSILASSSSATSASSCPWCRWRRPAWWPR